MTTLIEFLRARLDEEQRDAEAAYDGDGYREWDIPCTGVVQVAGGDLDGLVVAPRNAAIHIARHDPARVLADVAAKRAILDEHKPERVWTGSKYEGGKCTTCLLWESQGYSRYEDCPCPTLRALATAYADHPDFDPAWQPAEVTT